MNNAIEVKGLSYCYERDQIALENINMTIQPGEIVALVGQNGAGKTTLVKHFIGLLKPPPGQVTICGYDVAKTPISQLAKHIGFVFQNPDHQIFHESVQQEVAYGLKNLGLSPEEINFRVAAALRDVGIEDLAAENPHRLSRGQRQRVALASVLSMNTKVIVLDEPTTGQDYRERQQIMKLLVNLNKQGHTVFFITHDMSLVAQYAKRVLVLCQGKVILDGPTRQVLSQPNLLAQSLLEPPQITQLASQLDKITGFPDSQVILNVAEMYSYLQRMREGM